MIEVLDLEKSFGDTAVLHGISLDVQPAEILAVVGPSGAGKSTLSRCVNGLERPSNGRVLVDGSDLAHLNEKDLQAARRSIGTIFQNAPLLRQKTAIENVMVPLDYYGATKGAARKRAEGLLDRVGLLDRKNHYPSQLSGGQKQRVGIARALALAPSNLLSDEATSGLDPQTTRSILDLLSELRDELDLSILLITHEMDVVRKVADKVAWIDGGKIVEYGNVRKILHDQESKLGREILPQRPVIRPQAPGAAWEVVYSSDGVSLSWVGELHNTPGFEGVHTEILSATVENIDGGPVGRLVLSVSDVDDDVFRAFLLAHGLSGIRLDDDSVLSR